MGRIANPFNILERPDGKFQFTLNHTCGLPQRVTVEDITVGDWLEKFTAMTTSPRTGINVAENRPYSVATIKGYKKEFDLHIKNDPFCKLKMLEVEEEDALEFTTRMSVKKLKRGVAIGGTRTFVKMMKFVRMAFTAFGKPAVEKP